MKDRYVENHIYQEGGILYIFLEKDQDPEEFLKLAKETPEIEQIMTAREAAAAFHLPEDEIGDYVLLAARGCAFGEVPGERLKTEEVRTHGSLYEREIPLLAIHPQAPSEAYEYSKDIAAFIMDR